MISPAATGIEQIGVAVAELGPAHVAPERDVARDMAQRAVLLAPVLLGVLGAAWGWDGFFSGGYALVLVVVNLLLGAALITWSADISPNLMYGAVLGGYFVRLGIITAAVLPVRDAGWFAVVPFAIALLVSHLGLLIWETRRVAASLAYPGLKPTSRGLAAVFGSKPLSTKEQTAR